MRKSNLKQFNTIQNGDMSGSLTSSVSSIEFLDNIGVQINFVDGVTTAVGNFQVQVSVDYNQDGFGNVLNPGNWTPIYFTSAPLSGVDIPTTLGSPIFIDINQISAPWIRIVYTPTSGSGTANVWIAGKMV
jgi:hypothetical protein